MRSKWGNPFRPTVAGAVETMVAMGMTVVVTVFFVVMAVSPNVLQVQTL